MHENCPYLEFPWSVFSRIWPEYGDLLCKSPYLVQIRENTDQKTPNMDTFYAVRVTYLFKVFFGQIHYGRLAFQTHQLLKKIFYDLTN